MLDVLGPSLIDHRCSADTDMLVGFVPVGKRDPAGFNVDMPPLPVDECDDPPGINVDGLSHDIWPRCYNQTHLPKNNQRRNAVWSHPDDGILMKAAAQQDGSVLIRAEGKKALFRRPCAGRIGPSTLDDVRCG